MSSKSKAEPEAGTRWSLLARGLMPIAIVSLAVSLLVLFLTRQTEKDRKRLEVIVAQFTSSHSTLDYDGVNRVFGEPNLDLAMKQTTAIRLIRIHCRRRHYCIYLFRDCERPELIRLVSRIFFEDPNIINGCVDPRNTKFVELDRSSSILTGEQKTAYSDLINPSTLSKYQPFAAENKTENGIVPITALDGGLWLLESWDHGYYRVILREGELEPDLMQIVQRLSTLANVEKGMPKVHPLLGALPDRGLSGKGLSPQIFRRLMDYKIIDPLVEGYFINHFQEAELDAAEQLCRALKAKSEEHVEQMIGSPLYKGEAISRKLSKPGEVYWLYCFGGNKIPIRLTFSDGMCRTAIVSTPQEQREFERWKAKRISQFAHGKRLDEILKQEGFPVFAVDSNGNQVQAFGKNFSGKIYMGDKYASIVAGLSMVNGKCASESIDAFAR